MQDSNYPGNLDSGISVIIPVYNVERYLSTCLNSVVNQNFTKYEIICVNDGSTDNSLDILNNYKIKYDIKVISQKNGGLSAARNTGLKHVSKEYIVFLDSDDYFISDTTLKELYEVMKNNRLDILSFNYKTDSGVVGIKTNNKIMNGITYLTSGEVRVVSWNKIYATEYLKKLNFSFKRGIIHEDDESYLRLLSSAQRVMHVSKECIFYRTNNTTSITSQQKIEDNILGYETTLLTHFDIYKKTDNKILKKFIQKRVLFYLIKIAQYKYHLDSSEYDMYFFKNYPINFTTLEIMVIKYNILYSLQNELHLRIKELILSIIVRRVSKLYFK